MDVVEVIEKSQPEPFAQAIAEIEGTLPAGLDGTLLRNGAGRMQIGTDRVSFLDGHGMIAALDVKDGAAFFRVVHPDTEMRREELAAGRMTRRRVFTNLPGWWRNVFNLKLGNPGCHDVYAWGGKVYASDLGEHYALSVPKLETTGPERWASVVEPDEYLAPMPRDDHAKKSLIAYALRRSPSKGDSVSFVEVDEKLGRVARTASVPLTGVIHDQGFTERWYATFQIPAAPKPLPALLGTAPLWWSFGWRDEGPTLILVPRGRDGEAVKIRLDTPLRTVFHVINAYDDGDEVVIDMIGYEGPIHFDFQMPAAKGRAKRPGPENRIVRVRANPAAGTAEVIPFAGAHGEAPEVAPAVHGKRHRAAWFAALPSGAAAEPTAYVLTRRIGRLDVESGEVTTWDAGEGFHVSPPAFAPDPSADDPEAGWLLTWVLDLRKETTEVVVHDAHDLAAGPVARVKTGAYLPATSHARFVPGLRTRDA